MAKKNAVNEGTKNQAATSDLPEGFASVKSEQAVGWWRPEPGSVVRGTLIGRYQGYKDQPYYQIEASAPCTVHSKDSDGDPCEVEAQIGDRINVQERADLRALNALLDDGNIYEIYLKAISKENLDGGKTFWRFASGAKKIGEAEKAPF